MNLVSYSKLLEKAQNANALATTEDIVLATDQAFYNALQAQALLKVAQQTVTTRGSVQHQIDELTKSKLKSGLDLSFADVNLSQAKLLQLDAQNNVDSTSAALTAVLGFDKQVQFELTEEDTQLPSPPPDVDALDPHRHRATSRSAGARPTVNRPRKSSAGLSATSFCLPSARLALRE